MRVGLLGNMNNMLFSLTRILRRRGVDAEILLFDDESPHFHPSADTFDRNYMAYTRTLTWGSGRRFLTTSSRAIQADLSRYDVLIGCGLAPAYCMRAGRVLDVFVPYGGDILVETQFRAVRPDTLPSVWVAAMAQRRGIRAARRLHMPTTNPLYENRLAWLRGDRPRWRCGVPMVDPVVYDATSMRERQHETHWYRAFREVRAASDLLFVSSARHTWSDRVHDQHRKGTETLLRGLALVVEGHPELRVKLATIEYGPEFERTRGFACEIGLTRHVEWFPKMTRKDLMVGLSMADIVCGEFEIGWLESGTRYEALASSKPLLAFLHESRYVDQQAELYPLMNARTPEAIRDRVEAFLLSRAEHVAMGRRGREWYERFVVDAALEKYMEYLGMAPCRAPVTDGSGSARRTGE